MDNRSENTEKGKKKSSSGVNVRWILTISAVSFVLSVTMSYLSEQALNNVGNLIAFFILFLFVFIGILFDVIGVAATAATEKRFHSMAARKVKGAKQSIWIIRNAEKVGSFCNDVVGDISGIISGATSAIIIARLTQGGGIASVLMSLGITGCVASLTIGGKAIGKTFGISHSEDIIAVVGRLMALFSK